jgi:glycosyltransferase involved in cell wall biosynthesis
MDKLRILQVIPFFTPQMGGSAEVAYQISKHLAQRGHVVTVVTTDYARQRTRYEAKGVQVVEIPNWLAGFGFYLNPGLIAWNRQNLRAFDVIHLHTVRTFQNAVVAYYAHKYHIPYILSAHGTLPVIIERQLPKRLFDLAAGNNILKHAAGFHAVSEVEVEQFQVHKLPADKIHRIYNGLDLQAFEHLPEPGLFRRKLNIPAGSKLILHLGRIHKRKGIDSLIQAFAQLVRQDANLKLVVAGPDDGEQSNLEQLVKTLGLSNQVLFPGAVYGRDKLAALQDADLLVSTGVYEIFGLVPFEAMLCGTPVMVSDDCGAGRLVSQGEMGWLVKARDVNDLARKMSTALADPETCAGMVQRGKVYIQQTLDWEHSTAQIIQMYEKILK